MEIISKTSSTKTVVIGRMSDGSDRQETQVTTYNVKVSNSGKTLEMEFDHNPSNEDIMECISVGNFKDITTLEDQIAQLKEDNLAFKEDNLIIMEVLATLYEDMLAKGTV